MKREINIITRQGITKTSPMGSSASSIALYNEDFFLVAHEQENFIEVRQTLDGKVTTTIPIDLPDYMAVYKNEIYVRHRILLVER